MKTERYVVFAGDHYYPAGGTRDIVGSVSDLTDIWDLLKERKPYGWDWYNILDLVTGEVYEN